MASWMTEWAERGGNLLNSLDKGVANLLKAESVEAEEEESVVVPLEYSGRMSPSPRPPSPVKFPVKSNAPSAVVKPIPAATVALSQSKPPPIDRNGEDRLFEFLNSPAPMEQALSALQISTPQSINPSPSPPQPSPPARPEKESELALENRLLHQEVTSLNQEIADLMRRNKRAEGDIQTRDKEITNLRGQLQTAKMRLEEAKRRETQQAHTPVTTVAVSTPTTNTSTHQGLQSQVERLSRSLESTKQALKESEAKAAEAMKLSDISSGRVEQLRQEAVRLSRSMAAYKEKAAAVLAEKDRLIASLQEELKSEVRSSPKALFDEEEEAEVQRRQEEYDRLRQEAEQRLLAAAEMEERAEEEYASLKRTISLLEQQLAREKQLVADADAEIIDLQRRLTLVEEAAHRDSEALTVQLHSLEAEVSRLRRAAAVSPPSVPLSSAPAPRADTEARLLEMEAKARQLSDALLTKQDALDATLVQNHALKVRWDILVKIQYKYDNSRSPAFYPLDPFGATRSGVGCPTFGLWRPERPLQRVSFRQRLPATASGVFPGLRSSPLDRHDVAGLAACGDRWSGRLDDPSGGDAASSAAHPTPPHPLPRHLPCLAALLTLALRSTCSISTLILLLHILLIIVYSVVCCVSRVGVGAWTK